VRGHLTHGEIHGTQPHKPNLSISNTSTTDGTRTIDMQIMYVDWWVWLIDMAKSMGVNSAIKRRLRVLERLNTAAMLNYACEAGEAGKAGDGNTTAFTVAAAAKMTRAVR